MTVQSVGSVTAKISAVSNQAVPNAATDSFVKVYDNSRLNNNGQTARNQSKKNTDSFTDSAVRSDKPASKTVDDSTRADKPVKDEKPVYEMDNSVSETKESTDAEALEETLAALTELLNKISELLKQFFDSNDEELANAANEISLNPMDLISGDGIKDLFLKMNNASPEDLLSNEQLLSNLYEVQDAMKKLAEEILSDNMNLEKLAQMVNAGNNEELLHNPMFREVFDEYLADASEDISENEPVIEIKDLRDKNPEVISTDSQKADETEEISLKPVSEKEDSSKKESAGEKHDFITPNAFANKIAKALDEMQNAEPAKLNTFRDLYNITGQVIDKIKLTLTSDASSMEIQLHPEHLGKVDLQISSKNGIMSAELTAHSESAKRALEAGLEDLKVSLEQTGLKIENVEVTLADFGFRQRDDREQGEGRGESHHGRRRNISAIADENNLQKEFETVSDIMKELNGNSVDYTA